MKLCFDPISEAKMLPRTTMRVVLSAFAMSLLPAVLLGAPSIAYVQSAYATPQSASTTVNVTFTGTQAAGDLNVVVVGWNDSSATVSAITDSNGNQYVLAVGPTIQALVATQSVYYAKNIAAASAGTNTVTVTFTSGAKSPDIRILEYKGADPNNPVDVVAAGSGKSKTSSSGSVTTTNPADLIFGANLVQTVTSGAGSWFTNRLITSPDGDIAEDRMVASAGSYSATAPLSSGQWIMQMVAFRTPVSGGGTDTTPPTTPTNLAAAVSGTQINLSWTASTDNVGVTGYRLERCQGGSCSNFAQIAAPSTTTYSDSGLAAGSYSYRVRATDASGNLSGYSNTATAGVADTTPPTAPSNVTASTAGSAQINLTWTASTDNVGVTGYLVERCQGNGCSNFAQIATPTGATYNDTGLTANTSYSYRVRATDAAGNLSQYSNSASATTAPTATTISYVQGAYATPQSPSSVVNLTFTAAQAAGDLNVVVVGWNDSSATVSSVADSRGNQYVLAVGPTIQAPVATASVYYAKNITAASAGANTVSVTFTSGAKSPDIRILEYSGADPSNPVDVTAASTGTSGTSSSGAVTTTNATDLIFGANLVQTVTSGAGSGFTSRMITSPDGDIAEDRMVTSAGSYSATAPLSSGQWIMQMVAFRTPVSGGGTDTTPPTTPTNLAGAVSGTQINLSWTASTDNVGVTGYLLERCQGAGCSNFAQIAAPSKTTYSDSGLAAGSYSYRVRATDAAGNLSSYSNIANATVSTSLTISPRAATLTFTKTQQFNVSNGSVTWSVDGVVGGSASVGTISTSGLYSPPNAVGTHTVTATTSDQSQSVSAEVYITNYAGTFTVHNDNLRSGVNSSETVLTPANVNEGQFGKLSSYPVDGLAFASPLYVANVNIPGSGFHNVVYVATEHDSVYAFDADGSSGNPLWKVSFLQNGATTVPCGDTGECGDIPNEIGITGTPVIDPSDGTLYVVAKTEENSNYIQRLHALDITTGAEKFGGPVVIQATALGSGDGTGTVSFNALLENQRTGLLLSNGVVYLGFASHGDNGTYYGWVLGYNATTLKQTMAFNAAPNAAQAGIWQSGGGLATDATGDIFFTTGNGGFDANSGGLDYGDSVINLSTQGSVVDYFTPHDQANMESQDLDLSSAGPTLLVDQPGSVPHLLITAGKTGDIYVINRDNMGHYNPNNDNQIIQSLPNALLNSNLAHGNFSSPVYFNGYVYFGASGDHLKAFQLANGLLSTAPTSQSALTYPHRGGSFAVSANGVNNGILWAMQDNSPNTPNSGVLFAYDAGNLASEFYDTSQAGSRDALDVANKFSIPLVANGKVFVVTQTQLVVYGLLP
jgi:fibronectin type 3 domain-containing protein